MYLPTHFHETRIDVLHALMRARPLSTLVTTVESGLVEVYAGKVRRKLHAASASVLIETCRGIGYRLISSEAAAL